ncbi:hypothetical protein [Streptomyces sp. NPDC001404]|uniref:hypothetical protein n=1 Tax=Streptomyces sp. NPDC001404 TaxID=3364571 RepID=UPI00369D0518
MNRRLACLTARHIAAVAILNLGDLIRVCALIAIPVVIAAWADPVSTWKIDAPASGLAVIAFALQILVDNLVRLLAAAAVVAVVWVTAGGRRGGASTTYVTNNRGFLASWNSPNGPRR